MLPKGWRTLAVADICGFQNGHGFGPDDWDDHGLPIIRIQNLNGGTKFDYYSGIPEQRWLVHSGQMLFAWAGTRGVSFGPTIWRGQTGVLNQHIFKVEPKERIDAGWLYWALRHVTDRIEKSAHGFKATLLHVKKSDIEKQLVAAPPPVQQKSIATILDTWDKAIATLGCLLANSRRQKQALAAALLGGKRRLMTDSKWVSKPLSDLIIESRIVGAGGQTAQKLTVKLYGRGVFAKSEKRAGSDSTQYYKRQAGQLIYSKLDFLNGAFGIVPRELDDYQSTLDLPAFDFTDKTDPRWFLHLIGSEGFYRSQLGLANGGRKARRVNPSDLLRVSIDLPELREQRAIAEAIDAAIAEVLNYERQMASLQAQKRVLMTALLTGKRCMRLLQPAEAEPA